MPPDEDDLEWETFELENTEAPRDGMRIRSRRHNHSSQSVEMDLETDDLSCSSPPIAHSSKRKPGYIPRPPNPFMIFRSSFWKEEKTKTAAERDHRQISRMAADRWNQLSEKDREPYRLLAKEEKKRHSVLYPGYKYSPGGRTTSSGRKKIKNASSKRSTSTNATPPTRKTRRGKVTRSATPPDVESEDDSMPSSHPSPWTPHDHEDISMAIEGSSLPSGICNDHTFTTSLCASDSQMEEYVPTSEIPPLPLDGADPMVSSSLHNDQGQLFTHFLFKREGDEVIPRFEPLQYESVGTPSSYLNALSEPFSVKDFLSSTDLQLFEDPPDYGFLPPRNVSSIDFTIPFFEGELEPAFSASDYGNLMEDLCPKSAAAPLPDNAQSSHPNKEDNEFADWLNYDDISKVRDESSATTMMLSQ